MDRKDGIKRALTLLLILGLALCLTACRTRTSGSGGHETEAPASAGVTTDEAEGQRETDGAAAAGPGEMADPAAQDGGEPGEEPRENPDASRRAYDEDAPAEVVPGTEHLLHGDGEGSGKPADAPGEEDGERVPRLNEQAGETATQTVAAREAEEKGVSEDAEAADSAMTWYTVLLHDRMGSLFECQRATVYWETAEDHVTIHKTSLEHALLLNAGTGDVSARLLLENLRVDDGWVVRKNPQVIVKVVDSGVLGSGTVTTGAAEAVYRSLCAREGWQAVDAVRNRRVLLISRELLEAPHLQLAAMLLIDWTAHPDLFADVDADEALQRLSVEATGLMPAGIFYYRGTER